MKYRMHAQNDSEAFWENVSSSKINASMREVHMEESTGRLCALVCQWAPYTWTSRTFTAKELGSNSQWLPWKNLCHWLSYLLCIPTGSGSGSSQVQISKKHLMRENRVSKKKYQNKSTPQIIMSELHNSQFICSEIMTMHNTRFYIKIRWGAIFLAFVLFSCIIEFTS